MMSMGGDAVCPQPPNDPISSLAWAPPEITQTGKNFLCCGSWDNSVRIWEVQKQQYNNQVAAQPVGCAQNDLPVLDVAMAADGRVFFGGCCNTAKAYNLSQAGAPATQVAAHDLPVKAVKWSQERQILVTGSWDGKVKMWDTKTPNPGHQIDVGAPVVAMDVTGAMCTIATARGFIIFDLQSMREVKREQPHNTMREQIRCVANFPDKTGFASGSIEGRVAVMWLNPATSTTSKDGKNFTFRCHRESNNTEVYSVNGISFNTLFGTFATCGSNANITIWDKDQRTRLKGFDNLQNTVACCGFDSTGQLLGYALSYDWTKGAANYNASLGHKLCVKALKEEEVKPKKSSSSIGGKRW